MRSAPDWALWYLKEVIRWGGVLWGVKYPWCPRYELKYAMGIRIG